MSDLLSPEETKMVLARVAELQTARDGSAGTSRAELATVVSEAGLDAKLLPRAMQEVLGAKFDVGVERVGKTTVASCEVPRWLNQYDLRELAHRMGHQFGGTGQFVQQGDVWWWRGQGSTGAPIAISVRHVSSGSLVRLELGDATRVRRSILMGLAAMVASGFAASYMNLGAATAALPLVFGVATVLIDHYFQRRRQAGRNSTRAQAALSEGIGKLPLPAPTAGQ